MAITGGTGVYADASGTMTLHARDELGAELDFIFHVNLNDSADSSDHEDDGDSDDDDDSSDDEYDG